MNFQKNFNSKIFPEMGLNFSKYCKCSYNEFALVDSETVFLFDLSSLEIMKSKFNAKFINDIFYSPEQQMFFYSSKSSVVAVTKNHENLVFKTPEILDLNILSVTCHKNENIICGGSELKKSLFDKDENDALLVFWDIRNPLLPLGYYKDSHSDNVVSLSFKDEFLLSGGEDGLINVYNIRNATEDDALLITENTEDTVNKCGWLPKNDMIYCFTGTEKLLLWQGQHEQYNMVKNSKLLNSETKFLADCEETMDNEVVVLSLSQNSSSLFIDSFAKHFHIDAGEKVINNACFINNAQSVVAYSDNDIFVYY